MPISYQISFLRILVFLWRWSSFYICNFESLRTCILSLYSIVLFLLNVIFQPFVLKDIMHSLDVLRQALYITLFIALQFAIHCFIFSILLTSQLPSNTSYQSWNRSTVNAVCVCLFVPKFGNNSYFGKGLKNTKFSQAHCRNHYFNINL